MDARGTGVGAGKNVQGSFTTGELIAKDDKSVTIKLADGGSKVIIISDKTVVSQMTTGTMADIAIGQQLMVQGKTTSGSLVADSIQIRPAVEAPKDAETIPSVVPEVK